MMIYTTQISISDDSYLPKFLVDEEYWYPKVWETEKLAIEYQNKIIDKFVDWMKNDMSASPRDLVYDIKTSQSDKEIKKYVDIHYGDAIFQVLIVKQQIQTKIENSQ